MYCNTVQLNSNLTLTLKVQLNSNLTLGLVSLAKTRLIKPGARWPQASVPGFLELLYPRSSVCVCLCVCVSPPLRLLIISGMMWRDIDPI